MEMEFKTLREEAIKEVRTRYEKYRKDCDTETGLKYCLRWDKKNYKTNPKEKYLKWLAKQEIKDVNKTIEKIETVEKSEDFNEKQLTITVEWKPSQTWGSNPRAYTNYGFISESIGGCGYDKLSTATGQALNSFLPIMKLLYARENERLEKLKTENRTENKDKPDELSRRSYLGYGSGYGVLPAFEGGVGIQSHETIIQKLGLKMETVTSTKNTDVFIIKKV